MIPERLRRYFASSIVWMIFVLVYAAGAGTVLLGLILTGKAWWAAVEAGRPAWVLVYKSARVIFLALAFIFLAALPLIQLFSGRGEREAWADERRSEDKKAALRSRPQGRRRIRLK